MRLSARNIIKGIVREVVKGATTSHVKIEIAGAAVITASITNEAVDELRLSLATLEELWGPMKARCRN